MHWFILGKSKCMWKNMRQKYVQVENTKPFPNVSLSRHAHFLSHLLYSIFKITCIWTTKVHKVVTKIPFQISQTYVAENNDVLVNWSSNSRKLHYCGPDEFLRIRSRKISKYANVWCSSVFLILRASPIHSDIELPFAKGSEAFVTIKLTVLWLRKKKLLLLMSYICWVTNNLFH